MSDGTPPVDPSLIGPPPPGPAIPESALEPPTGQAPFDLPPPVDVAPAAATPAPVLSLGIDPTLGATPDATASDAATSDERPLTRAELRRMREATGALGAASAVNASVAPDLAADVPTAVADPAAPTDVSGVDAASAAAVTGAAVEGGRAARRRAAEAGGSTGTTSRGSAPAKETTPPRAPKAPQEPKPPKEPRPDRDSGDESRRRMFLVSGAVLGLLALLVGGYLVSRARDSGAGPGPTPTATATGPVQPTMLLQVRNAEGVAVDNALLSVGGSVQLANIITIPPDTIVDPPTGAPLPFGQVARLPGASTSANALSDAIGVDVDSTFSMDSLAFSGLVDAVGGVAVDVDVDVMAKGPDGTTVVVVPAGKNQLLQGPQATAYATYLAPGEPEAARMARFVTVLRLTLAKLPPEVEKIESIVTGLGASAQSTASASDVARFFQRLSKDINADNVAYNTIPVKQVETGGGPAVSRIDQEATAALVTLYLPDAQRKPGPNSKVRVLVQNGVGTPGLNAAARQLLVGAGFTYVNGGNAPKFGQVKTVIVVPDGSVDSLQWGSDIATALKVPPTAVSIAAQPQSVADVIVVLGADFTPAASS
jgi:anionic cell wall polymer biosynthesis LytR-Cps2A-Psr (LCP) family protein